MPWRPWGWHRLLSYNNVAEEEDSSTPHEADYDIEAVPPHHHLRQDERGQLDNAFSQDVEEEEKQESLVEQQQYQFDSSTGSPYRREWGRQYSPISQHDVEEGGGAFMAGGGETTPVRSRHIVELHIDTASSNGDIHYQDSSSDISTLSSDEVQDNLESVEGSVTTQSGCFQLWKEFAIKRNIRKCVVLAIGCVLAFDFFLQLQHKLTEIASSLETEDNIPEHSVQWTSVFVPLWLLTMFSLCQCLFDLICIGVGTGNRNALLSSGFTSYLCVAWGSAVSLGFLVWVRLEGVLDNIPVSITMIPCWVLAFFGTLLLHFATPPLAIENTGVDQVFAFQAEMSIAIRLNLWIFGFQCICIALKLDTGVPISWSRTMLPTVLLLITTGVIVVPFMLGIFMTCMSLAHQIGLSRELAFSFITSATPLLIGGAVVYFGLSGLSSLARALNDDGVADSLSIQYREASEALNPFLQLCAVLAVLLPLFVTTENDVGLLELMTNQDGFMRGMDEGDQVSENPTPSPKFQPISSPTVLLRQGGEYFQQASKSIRHRLLHSPLYNSSSRPIEQKECYVCIENTADAVVLPCGHGGLCMQCAKSIVKGPTEHRHCPICRAGIERVVNVGNRAIIRWQSEDFIRCEDGVDIITTQESPDIV